jgi:hypothetical protein
MNETQIYDRHGRKVTGSIVPDGGKITVPLLMMDDAPTDIADTTNQPQAALLHRPGFADAGNAAEREKLLDARDARLSSAWRNPPAFDTAQSEQPKPPSATDAAEARYAARDARLEQVWRQGGV